MVVAQQDEKRRGNIGIIQPQEEEQGREEADVDGRVNGAREEGSFSPVVRKVCRRSISFLQKAVQARENGKADLRNEQG